MIGTSLKHLDRGEKSLHIFHINFDIDDSGKLMQPLDKFSSDLFNLIPEFALGSQCIDRIKKEYGDEAHMKLAREGMRLMYEIKEVAQARDIYLSDTGEYNDQYNRRGEFGELLLFSVLKKVFDAKALISKIYLKDSSAASAHGFDAVHVDINEKTLWLGEAKLYKDGSNAISALIDDLRNHFNRNFFNSEFIIINNRVDDIGESVSDDIRRIISPDTPHLERLKNIKIALFAGYDSACIKGQCQNMESDEVFEDKLVSEAEGLMSKLAKGKNQHGWDTIMDVYLFLMPLNDKYEFVKYLHKKLEAGQQI